MSVVYLYLQVDQIPTIAGGWITVMLFGYVFGQLVTGSNIGRVESIRGGSAASTQTTNGPAGMI
jgi:cytochrome bd-type quinol oxidase subunit 2